MTVKQCKLLSTDGCRAQERVFDRSVLCLVLLFCKNHQKRLNE